MVSKKTTRKGKYKDEKMGSTKTTKWEVQRRQNGKYKYDKVGNTKTPEWEIQIQDNVKFKDDKKVLR
jgi:hypothetical protein